MAAAALSRDGREDNVGQGVEFRTRTDGLRVVASIDGSMEYQSIYQQVRAEFVS